MTSFDINWRKLVTLLSQQHDVIKYKETVYESFNLYPTSRPALLDLFSDIIVDKYVHNFIHQRNIYTSELEEVIGVLFKEINSILDKEFECPDYVSTALKSKVSHYSGHGFNNYVCQWVLIVLLKITVKYDQILSINDPVLPNEKMHWNQVPVIMDLLDILCKTINSKMVGHEVVSIIMRNVSQHRNHLLWVVKYIGERHSCGIVEKIIDCILSEFVPQQEFSKLQSCMLVLSNLGSHHARQLQSALFEKLKVAIEESSNTVSQHKFTNYQTLIYFTLLLASRSDLFELTTASLSMISRIICIFNPKQLEQFFLNQNFTDNILRSYYHMTLNIMMNSQDLEIGRVLEFLVQHSHKTSTSTCCSVQFSHMCTNVVETVCSKLLIQSHASFVSESSVNRTMSLAVLNAVMQRIEYWMSRVVKDGSSVAAKLLCSIILNDFKTVGEDLLAAIVTNVPSSPQEVSGHKAAMVLFFRILDECELVSGDLLDQVLVRSLCVGQSMKSSHQQRLLSTLLSMLAYEARMQSQRRRLARTISANLDLLLLLAVTNKSLPVIRLSLAICQKIDAISDERFSTRSTSPFAPCPADSRFKSWPIFVSTRVTRSLTVMYTVLVTSGHQNASTRLLANILVNYLRCTDARHNSAAVQIVFREYLRSSQIETNNRCVFKKTLKPGWFGTKLVHDSGPVSNNVGQLHICRQRAANNGNHYDRLQEMHWQHLLMTLCHFQRSYDLAGTTGAQVIHWVIRQTLCPSYYLPVNPDDKVILKDLNSITTLWRRFNSVDIFWSLFNMLAHVAPETLDSSYQTLKALMIACEHLWSTSDCPKRRLIRKVAESEIFVTESKDEEIVEKQKYYEVINTGSALYRSTVSLLECLAHRMPLAEELKLMLPYLSSTEVQTVLTHLAFNWNKLQQQHKMMLGEKDRLIGAVVLGGGQGILGGGQGLPGGGQGILGGGQGILGGGQGILGGGQGLPGGGQGILGGGQGLPGGGQGLPGGGQGILGGGQGLPGGGQGLPGGGQGLPGGGQGIPGGGQGILGGGQGLPGGGILGGGQGLPGGGILGGGQGILGGGQGMLGGGQGMLGGGQGILGGGPGVVGGGAISPNDHDNEDVPMAEPVLSEEVQVKNTFSWDTLLPAIVHSRIHFKSLYDQFYRLLFVAYDY